MKRTFLILILFMGACTKEKMENLDNNYLGAYKYYSILNRNTNQLTIINKLNEIIIDKDSIEIGGIKYDYDYVEVEDKKLILPKYTDFSYGTYQYNNGELNLYLKDYIHTYIKQ